MKKLILTSSLVVVVLISVSINKAQCQSEKKIKATIEKLNSEMIDAMMNKDYQKGLTYYVEDAISLPSYEPMLIGKEAIKKSQEAMVNSGMKMESFELSIEKLIIHNDLIIEIGRYSMSMEMPGMDDSIKDNGKYLTVWEKQKDGTLKVKADTWNTDNNPWMQMSAQK